MIVRTVSFESVIVFIHMKQSKTYLSTFISDALTFPAARRYSSDLPLVFLLHLCVYFIPSTKV